MRKFLSIVTLLLFSSGTISGNPISNDAPTKKKKKTNDQCVINTKNEILEEIINFNDIKEHFGISTRRNNNIKVFKNAYFDQTTNVSINFEKVLIVDNLSRYPDALIIDFSDIDCNSQAAQFSITSRTKSIQMLGGLRKDNGQWAIQILSYKQL